MIIPYLTTMIDFASETSFPIGESISGGLLLFGGQILAVIVSFLFNQFLFGSKEIYKIRISLFVIILVFFIGGILLHFCKLILKRNDF